MDEEQKKLAEELLANQPKRPSFAKQLFFGRFDGDSILPFPSPSAEEKERLNAMLQKTMQFLEHEVDADAIDRQAEIPNEVILGLGQLGVLGATIPTDFGGQSMSQLAYGQLVEAVGAHCAATAVFINVHQSVGLKSLTLFGTPEQQERFLPKLATGEWLAAFALTEKNAGSDAGALETTATYDAEKRVYRLNGTKQWISMGSKAQMLTVMARTDDGKITGFLVTPDMPGFEVTHASLEKVGGRGLTTSCLAFHDMEVPEANVFGEKGRGLQAALSILNYGRTTFGSICLGTARVCEKLAIAHAQTRYQFKKPLASFPLIKQKIATISAYTYAMDAMTNLTAGILDRNAKNAMVESAMLKVFASEALWDIVYETMQVYGGRSFFTDAPLERMMRDARINMVVEGANEVLHAFIGAVGLREVGLSLKEQSESVGGYVGIAGQLLGTLSAPHIALKSPQLKKPALMLSSRIRQLGAIVPRLLAKHREAIIEEQLTLDRVAMAATMLYSISAVLAKCDQALSGAADSELELEIALYYCSVACDRFDHYYHALTHNNDKMMLELANLL